MRCVLFPIVVLAAIISSTTKAAENPVSNGINEPARLTEAPTPPVDEVRPRTARVVSPHIRAAVLTGAQLRTDSELAFHRGLLPLTDFLEHLAAAEEADVWLATSHSDKDAQPSVQALLAAVQPRITALRRAVRKLEAFQQPAAANWQADVLLGKFVLAQAEEEAARLAGDTGATDRALRSQSVIAIEHYRQRVFDARILGHASLPEVTRAVSFLNIDPTQKRAMLHRAVVTTQHWHAAGSGIGRSDRVLEARLQVALWDAEPRSTKTDRATLRQGLIEADRLSSQLFATQRGYYQHGTATLADLSRSWQTRRQVHLLADWAGTLLPASSTSRHTRELQDLTTLAASIRDRRDRHASDVRYVQLLGSLHAGESVRHSSSYE